MRSLCGTEVLHTRTHTRNRNLSQAPIALLKKGTVILTEISFLSAGPDVEPIVQSRWLLVLHIYDSHPLAEPDRLVSPFAPPDEAIDQLALALKLRSSASGKGDGGGREGEGREGGARESETNGTANG